MKKTTEARTIAGLQKKLRAMHADGLAFRAEAQRWMDKAMAARAVAEQAGVPSGTLAQQMQFLVDQRTGSEELVRALRRDLEDARRREAPRWPWPFSWVLG